MAQYTQEDQRISESNTTEDIEGELDIEEYIDSQMRTKRPNWLYRGGILLIICFLGYWLVSIPYQGNLEKEPRQEIPLAEYFAKPEYPISLDRVMRNEERRLVKLMEAELISTQEFNEESEWLRTRKEELFERWKDAGQPQDHQPSQSLFRRYTLAHAGNLDDSTDNLGVYILSVE